MHKLLRRQVRQSQKDGAIDVAALLALVEAAYEEVDRERRIMSHAYQVMRDEQATLAARQVKTHEMMAQIRAEKAEAERARAVAESELLKQERLSVLGQLTATVAHELRNPLSAIRNSIYAIRDVSAGANSPLDRPMQRIERNIRRCDAIIDDLLDYARVREPHFEPLELDPWLGEVLDDQSVPAGVRLERRLAAPGARVSLDPDRFRRVINNLVENAFQALVEASGWPMCVTVSSTATDGLEITVEDQGPGIPPQVLPRIFEPLFSTKSFGTGLGLPTVKQIVEQHRGSIDVASAPGEGTRVRVRLPVQTARSAQQASAA
jgi:signal transduction histidine kinase